MSQATIRPSNLFRRDRCPGSYNAELQFEEEQTSEAAEHGSILHRLIAEGILKPQERVNLMAQAPEADDCAILEACWGEAERCWGALSPDQRKQAKVLVERKVSLKSVGIDDDGTPDFCIAVAGTEAEDGLLILRDWKSGIGWVPGPRWNLQLMAYAVSLRAELGLTGPASIGVTQPLRSPNTDVFLAVTSDLDYVAKRIKSVVELCMRPDAPRIPGNWCSYCRAAGKCQQQMAVIAEVQQVANPLATMRALEGENRREFYERLDRAFGLLKKAIEQIDAAIIEGSLIVLGYGPGPGKNGRYWLDEPAVLIPKLHAMAAQKGLDQLDIIEPLSVSKIEKLLGKKAVENMFGVKPGNPTVKKLKG